MNNPATTDPEPSVTRLVTGIANDMEELLAQQLALFKIEIREDGHKAAEALLFVAAGVGITTVGGLLLGMMLVYLVHWLFEPSLPLWGCFACVGGLIAALGVGFLSIGKNKIASLKLLPEQSLEVMKENVAWRTKPR